MNRTLTSWFFAGALAASLSWNWKQYESRSTEPSCSAEASCSDFDEAGLDLDAEQRAALEKLCRRSCDVSDRIEGRADELQRDLLASLTRPEVDGEKALRLAEEVGDLRRQALKACVEGILEVRKVLTPEQVRALLAQCEPGASSCR